MPVYPFHNILHLFLLLLLSGCSNFVDFASEGQRNSEEEQAKETSRMPDNLQTALLDKSSDACTTATGKEAQKIANISLSKDNTDGSIVHTFSLDLENVEAGHFEREYSHRRLKPGIHRMVLTIIKEFYGTEFHQNDFMDFIPINVDLGIKNIQLTAEVKAGHNYGLAVTSLTEQKACKVCVMETPRDRNSYPLKTLTREVQCQLLR